VSGNDIIGALLQADADLTAVVLPKSIKAGRLPDDTPLPALLVRTVSVVERHLLKRSGWERTTARISVAVRTVNYLQQEQVIKLVRRCCAGRTGNIGGGTRVSILTAGLGPDVNGPGDTFEQTQDFRVSFDAPV
jgi:hypothetical protein